MTSCGQRRLDRRRTMSEPAAIAWSERHRINRPWLERRWSFSGFVTIRAWARRHGRRRLRRRKPGRRRWQAQRNAVRLDTVCVRGYVRLRIRPGHGGKSWCWSMTICIWLHHCRNCYSWSILTMSSCPKRIRPTCATSRSLTPILVAWAIRSFTSRSSAHNRRFSVSAISTTMPSAQCSYRLTTVVCMGLFSFAKSKICLFRGVTFKKYV